MKCAACGYEKRERKYETEKVVYYKSGKRKGKIKEIKTIFIEPDEDKPKFQKINFNEGKNIVIPSTRNEDKEARYIGNYYADKEIVSCPRCGTLRLNDWFYETDNYE